MPSLLAGLTRRTRVPYVLLTLCVALLLASTQIQNQGRGLDDSVQRHRGESSLAFLSTLDDDHLPSWRLDDLSKGDKLFGPFGATTAILIGRFLGPLIGDVEERRWLEFHAGLTIWFLLFFWATCHLGKHATRSTWGGAMAGLFLLLQPRILGLSTVNPSDLPAAAATALSLLALLRWWDKRRWHETIIVCAGLAMTAAIRPQNVMVALPVLLAFLLFAQHFEPRSDEASPLPKTMLLVAPFLTYAFFILFWFDFWLEPVRGPIQLVEGFLSSSDRYVQETLWFGSRSTPLLYPLVYFALTTPLWLLLPFLLGVVVPKHEARPLSWTLGLWMILSMGKHLSGFGNHGGIRHFMDAYVPVAIFAAWGLIWLARNVGLRPVVVAVMTLLLFYFPFNGRGHPYESSYYNVLIGGARGAAGKLDLEPDGSSFVQLLYALQPELRSGDILLTVGPRDLVDQLDLPHDPVIHELLPDNLPLFETQAENRFAGHRVLILHGQDRSWGQLDKLIQDGVLETIVSRGVADLPVMRALEVKKPQFWQRLSELFESPRD